MSQKKVAEEGEYSLNLGIYSSYIEPKIMWQNVSKEWNIIILIFKYNKIIKRRKDQLIQVVLWTNGILVSVVLSSVKTKTKNNTRPVNFFTDSVIHCQNCNPEKCIQLTCCSRSQSGWPLFWSHPKLWESVFSVCVCGDFRFWYFV